MSISAVLVVALVALAIIGSGVLLLRVLGRDRADEARSYRAGVALAATYLLAWLGMIVLFGYNNDVVEGFGIASIMFGLPWSLLGMFLLGDPVYLYNQSWGIPWEVLITTFSLLGIALNTWLLFQFGQRFFGMFPVRRAADNT